MCNKKNQEDMKKELLALLHHMENHNHHHMDDLKKMKEQAGTLRMSDVAEELAISTELFRRATESLHRAYYLAGKAGGED